jgi:uncharacterized protein (DUF1778 family)
MSSCDGVKGWAKQTAHLTQRIPAELRDLITYAAQVENTKRSNIVRQALERGLSQYKAQTENPPKAA